MGTFALFALTAGGPVRDAERRALRALMDDPEYHGFGAGDTLPQALQLFRLCEDTAC